MRRLAAVGAGLVLLAGCSSGFSGKSSSDPVPPSQGTSVPAADDPAGRPEFASFYQQKITWRDCHDGFDCTSVKVPVDWSQPAKASLDLAVVRRKADGDSIGSLLMNPGGPGASGVEWVRAAASSYGSSLRSSFDIIGWDPRGIGGSSQIKCLTNEQIDKFVSSDPTPDTPAEKAEIIKDSRDFATGCQLRTGAFFVAHVDTLSTVKDMDVLRAVLGDKTLSYFGASYGTFLGAWYAEEFPWRVGRLVLDGGIDPSLDSKGYIEGQAMGFSRAIQAYMTDCLKQKECPFRGSVEEAKAQLADLIERSDQQPLPTTSRRKLTQGLLITGIVQGMYSDRLWDPLSRAISQAMQGDGSGLIELADQYYQREETGQYGAVVQSNGPIYCLDHPETRTDEQIAAHAEELQRRYPPLGASMAWSALSCKYWPIAPVMKPRKLTAQGAAPILVVGSTGDPATPYEWSQALASQLSGGHLLTREGFGHTGYGESKCVNEAVDKYLISGKTPEQGTVCK
jgi:pimeloyl-ACP methyl ester carboxylesterase